jgi:hypothetical protein
VTLFAGVLGALAMLAMLALGLGWTWGTGREHHGPSAPDPADSTGDGLLSEVARVPTEAAAQVLRARLADAGLRSTVGNDGRGYRLLVFERDEVTAKLVLNG